MNADILQSFAECLRSAGLTASCTVAANRQTQSQGRRVQGISDAPASIWWKNWRTGDEGTWTAKVGNELTVGQHKALRERLAAAKADTKAEQAQRWKAAAKLATSIWNYAKPAESDHPYLKRKAVPAIGLRRTADGRLIIPILNQSGQIQSLQFILPEKPPNGPDKLFLRSGKTAFSLFQQRVTPRTARCSLSKATPQGQACIWLPETLCCLPLPP